MLPGLRASVGAKQAKAFTLPILARGLMLSGPLNVFGVLSLALRICSSPNVHRGIL